MYNLNMIKSSYSHQNTDEFISYFSSVPQFPLFSSSNKKQKSKNKKSSKSLFNKFHSQRLLSSKKQYELEAKYQEVKKSKKNLDKNAMDSSAQLNDLVKAVQSTYFPKFNSQKSRKDITIIQRSFKSVKSSSPRTAISRTVSTRKETLQKNQYENILNKCHLVLSIYQEKVIKLEKQNKRLLADNKRMRSKIKSVEVQSNF